jgi:HEAT repeat protein
VPFRFDWQKGYAYTYALSYKSSIQSRAGIATGDNPLRGALELDGELTLACLGRRAGGGADAGTLFTLRLGALTRHSLEALGQQAIPDADAAKKTFDGQEATLEVDSRGGIRRVYFANGANEIFKAVVRAIAPSLHVTTPADEGSAETWEAEEPGPSGTGTVRYTRGLTGEAGVSVATRSRVGYQSLLALDAHTARAGEQKLAGNSEFRVEGGILKAYEESEALEVKLPGGTVALESAVNASLRHLRTTPFEAPTEVTLDESQLEGFTPGERGGATEAAEKASLEALAGDVTMEGIDTQLALLGPGGTFPDGFLTKSVAYLTLHPELCEDLAARFQDDALTPRAREAIAGVLASVGTREAQQALVKALKTSAATSDRDSYIALVQRVSFVKRPTPETVAFADQLYVDARKRGDKDLAAAASYVVGSTAGRLVSTGRVDEAARLASKLATELEQAKTPEKKETLLRALGNAGLPGQVRTVVAHARDKEPLVRAAAATALRKTKTPEAHETLLAMTKDRDARVGEAALEAIALHPLEPKDVRTIAEVAMDASTSRDLDPALATFFATHSDPPDVVDQALEAMLARADGDPNAQLRIQQLREGLRARREGGRPPRPVR